MEQERVYYIQLNVRIKVIDVLDQEKKITKETTIGIASKRKKALEIVNDFESSPFLQDESIMEYMILVWHAKVDINLMDKDNKNCMNLVYLFDQNKNIIYEKR